MSYTAAPLAVITYRTPGRDKISSGTKSFIRPVAGTKSTPLSWARTRASRFSRDRYLCWVMVVPSRSKASNLMSPNGIPPHDSLL